MATKHISDKQVINAYLQGRKEDTFPYDILHEQTGQPIKVCCSAIERAEERGYIECGVSLRSGWVTDSGMRLIKEDSNE